MAQRKVDSNVATLELDFLHMLVERLSRVEEENHDQRRKLGEAEKENEMLRRNI